MCIASLCCCFCRHLSILLFSQSGVKHMQVISGVSMVMFWAPTFLWDACSFIVPTVLLFCLIHFAGNRAYLEENNWTLCLLAVALFVWAILPVMYAVHFVFESAAQGLAGVLVCNLFSGGFHPHSTRKLEKRM